MTGSDGVEQRDLVTLVVDSVGGVVETDVIWEPYRLVDQRGEVVTAVSEFLHDMQASGRTAATQRSYALDLLRWFRFLWAVDVSWVQATRYEARDFSRWLALVDKPRRAGTHKRAAGAANPVTGKRSPGGRYERLTNSTSSPNRASKGCVIRTVIGDRSAGSGVVDNSVERPIRVLQPPGQTPGAAPPSAFATCQPNGAAYTLVAPATPGGPKL